MALRVTALAGGVGGAKLACGLAAVLPAQDLAIVVNTADDFEHLGLRISPDLDTVVYSLAGVVNRRTGWGRDRETWDFLEAVGDLGGPTWFRLGDRDLALHVLRTQRLRAGHELSEVTRDVCQAFDVRPVVLPMTDDNVRTLVKTDQGELPFQEYFVHLACEPAVRGFRFDGAESARPAPGVLEALRLADLVIICPSNPWVSIDPILSVPGIRQVVTSRPTVAVSPLVGGKALKGPAGKMAAELGVETTPVAIARHYGGMLTGLMYDEADADASAVLLDLGVRSRRTRTVMRSDRDRRRVAEQLLEFGDSLIRVKSA